MHYYVGLDISDATTNICVINELGNIANESVTSTDPQAIMSLLNSLNIPIEKIGMETGAKSNYLCHILSSHYNITCYDSYKVAKIIAAKGNKTDKNDARLIAEIARISGFSNVLNLEVHVKSSLAQEILTLIRTRESLVQRFVDTYNQIRAIYKSSGLCLPPTTPENVKKLISKTINQLPENSTTCVRILMETYESMRRGIQQLTQKIEELVKTDSNAQLLKTVPGVGSITALYFSVCIDDPKRFSQAKSAGSYFGLVPLEYSSGQHQHQGAISKRGDILMRKLLVGASRRILQNNSPANALKKWGQKKIKRLGKNRSAIALARKLSVIMTAIMIAQTAYAEPATLPPSQGVNFSIQELARLNDLAQKNGKIAVKSIKRLKKLAQSA